MLQRLIGDTAGHSKLMYLSFIPISAGIGLASTGSMKFTWTGRFAAWLKRAHCSVPHYAMQHVSLHSVITVCPNLSLYALYLPLARCNCTRWAECVLTIACHCLPPFFSLFVVIERFVNAGH